MAPVLHGKVLNLVVILEEDLGKDRRISRTVHRKRKARKTRNIPGMDSTVGFDLTVFESAPRRQGLVHAGSD